MPRNLIRCAALALTLVLAPGLSQALGLGGIKSDAVLNEPFVGLIELNGVTPEELDGVKVTLASEDEFTKVGSLRSHFLTRLTFVPEVSSTGLPQIRVTSPEPIREPYLDFLIEVTWPQGRLIKAYTVLLDPPLAQRRPVPAVSPPRVQATDAVAPPDLAAPEASPAPVSTALTGSPAAPVVSALSPLSPPSLGPPQAAGLSAEGYPIRFGPVPAGANLSQVARRLAPAGASLAQTALALYRANPQAFGGGKINNLLVGAHLEIPDPGLVFALDAETAKQQFQAARQGQPLPPLPAPPGQGQPPSPSVAPKGPSPDMATTLVSATPASPAEDHLRIASRAPRDTAAETEPQAPPQPLSGPPVDLRAPPQAPPGPPVDLQAPDQPGGDPELVRVEREMLLVREMAESSREEAADLRARLNRLEERLADVVSLLKLNKIEQDGLATTSGPPAPAAATAPALDSASAPPLASAANLTSAPPQASAPAPASAPTASQLAAPPTSAVQPPRAATGDEAPQPEPSFFDDLLASDVFSRWSLTMGAPLLLALLGLLIIVRRQKQAKAGDQSKAKLVGVALDSAPGSITTSTAPPVPRPAFNAPPRTGHPWPPAKGGSEDPAMILAASPAKQPEDPASPNPLTSAPLDLTAGDFELDLEGMEKLALAEETPKTDLPKTANPRTDQAEEVIVDLDLKLDDLLDLDLGTLGEAEQVADSGLLKTPTTAGTQTLSAAYAAPMASADPAITLLTPPPQPSPARGEGERESAAWATEAGPGSGGAVRLPTARFDLEPLELPLEPLELPLEPLELPLEQHLDRLELPQEALEPPLELPMELALEPLESPLKVPQESPREPPLKMPQEPPAPMASALGPLHERHRFEQGWDQQSPAPMALAPGSQPPGVTHEDGPFLTDLQFEYNPLDEVGIKLDLARAYLRMDDREAARSILAEAMAEGTADQVAEAKALLGRLG